MRSLGMPIYSQIDWINRFRASNYIDGPVDVYNQSGRVEELEKRVATLLEKPASLFFPKGTIAQLCALKVAAQQRDNNKVIMHSMSHMMLDEDNAYEFIMGLHALPIGNCDSPFDMNDIKTVNAQVATLTIEIPIRRAGFKLTPWSELEAMSQWCKDQKVHCHMDGARLWESTYAYQKSLGQISALFDSVYVSMYKGIGAIGGAVLAGESDFIDSCKVWRNRLGGNCFTSFPLIIGALDGLDNKLTQIPEFVVRAHNIAKLLKQFEQLEVNLPQTNAFFVFLEGDVVKLGKKAKQLNEKMKLTLFNTFNKFPNTHKHMIEIQVGAGHSHISDQEIVDYFTYLLDVG